MEVIQKSDLTQIEETKTCRVDLVKGIKWDIKKIHVWHLEFEQFTQTTKWRVRIEILAYITWRWLESTTDETSWI